MSVLPLPSIPPVWAALALTVSVIGAYAWGRQDGRELEAGAHAKALHAQAVAYAGEIVRQQGEVDTIAADLQAARAAQRPRDRIITKEVVRYETLPADRRCTLDGAWRLLHDAAATGAPADTARVVAGDAPAVADAAALETVAGNYESCRDAQQQVAGWQRWWAAVRPAGREGR